MIQRRKGIRNYNQMIEAYEDSCLLITQRYTSEISKITQDSVKTLQTLFHSYLEQKKILPDSCQSSQFNTSTSTAAKLASKAQPSVTQPLRPEDEFPLPWNRLNQQPQPHNMVFPKKQNAFSFGSESLLLDEDEREDSPTVKHTQIQDIKNKKLADIIMESQKKLKEKADKENLPVEELQEDSEYQLSEFGSNYSSDEEKYSPHYAQQPSEKTQPLFGGLFANSTSLETLSNSSTNNLLKFNFTAKQLLKSPKKEPKSKRLYMGSKKVPKWAEDLERIQAECHAQKTDPRKIFGKFVAENVEVGVIFRGHEDQHPIRTSSAKWDSNIFVT